MIRIGLRGKFVLTLTLTALVLVGVVGFAWRSAGQAVADVLEQSRETLREQAREAIEDRARQLAGLLAETLTNPLYFFDMLSMREVVGSALSQPDVRHVLVYDADGRLLHDGSREIRSFGQIMDDPLADEAISANAPLVQWGDGLIDASVPIRIGDRHLGGVRVGLSLERVDAAAAAEFDALRLRLQHGLAGPAHVLALGFLVLAAWVALAGWLVARGLVRPIRMLAAQAAEIERGHYEQHTASRRRDELGELIRAFGRMSAAVRRHQQDIRQLAYHDSLTELPNRLMLRELLDERIKAAAGSGLALLFIDLDDFKRINDTLGHDAGDHVLVQFAGRLRRAVSEVASDPVMARLGGDEFVVLIEAEQPRHSGGQAAEAILRVLRDPFEVAGHRFSIGASIGITVYPDDAQSARLLLKHGDLAMYEAKQQGKSCHRFFADHLTVEAEARLGLEQDLREALQSGRLELAYQPIHVLTDGRMVGVEALLRWDHPLRGWIPPSVFVPVAEGSGLIDELGDWVLDRACAEASAWQALRPGFAVAVNLSARQLQRSDLGERIGATLARHGLEPGLLHLELTESSLLHDEEPAFNALARLRQTGVQVWLDDFGTGFSALSHLRRARVDGVKIDRSFISDILRDAEDLALVTAIIAMAHSLGMQVIAEGVETDAQYQLLKTRGCDMAQGFVLRPAVPAAELFAEGAVG